MHVVRKMIHIHISLKKNYKWKTLIMGKTVKDFECNKITTSSENGDHLLIKEAGTYIYLFYLNHTHNGIQ